MSPLESLLERGRLLVIAPHPDDESLAMGGLLQAARAAGATLRVLFLTRGDNNPWPQRLLERRWRLGPADRERWGRRRLAEAGRALAALGIPESDCAFQNFPDQGLTARLLSGAGDVIQCFEKELAALRPTLIVTSSLCDLHPDHSAAAVMLRLALDRESGPGDAASEPPRLLEYIVHPKSARAGGGAWALALSPEGRERKRAAILSHISQVKGRAWHQLAHAEGDEYYLPAGTPDDGLAAGHGVREARVVANELWLKLGLRPRWGLGVFGPATLLLAASRQGRLVAAAELDLPSRPGEASLRVTPLAAEGGAGAGANAVPSPTPILFAARFAGTYADGEASLPRSALGDYDRLYVKIKRRHGFFDECGWRPL